MPHWVKKFRNALDSNGRELAYKGQHAASNDVLVECSLEIGEESCDVLCVLIELTLCALQLLRLKTNTFLDRNFIFISRFCQQSWVRLDFVPLNLEENYPSTQASGKADAIATGQSEYSPCPLHEGEEIDAVIMFCTSSFSIDLFRSCNVSQCLIHYPTTSHVVLSKMSTYGGECREGWICCCYLDL